jgi:hypothetical protein
VVEFLVGQGQDAAGRKPIDESRPGMADGGRQTVGEGAAAAGPFEEDDEEDLQVVQVLTLGVEVVVASPKGRIRHRVRVSFVWNPRTSLFQEVLEEAEALVEEAECPLEAAGDLLALGGLQAFVVHASDTEDDSDVAALGEEDAVVEEAVQVEEPVDGARLAVAPEHAAVADHGRLLT